MEHDRHTDYVPRDQEVKFEEFLDNVIGLEWEKESDDETGLYMYTIFSVDFEENEKIQDMLNFIGAIAEEDLVNYKTPLIEIDDEFIEQCEMEAFGDPEEYEGKLEAIITEEKKFNFGDFLTIGLLMFDACTVNGMEYRELTGKMIICFKNNQYIAKEVSLTEYKMIQDSFIRIIKQSLRVKFSKYIHNETLIFSIARLGSIDYRDGQAQIIFKDGQFLKQRMQEKDYDRLQYITVEAMKAATNV